MVELVKPEDMLVKTAYAIANPVTGHLVQRDTHLHAQSIPMPQGVLRPEK